MSLPMNPCPSWSTGPRWAATPKLDTRGVAGDMVVAADQAAEPFRQRIDDGLCGDTGRDDDQCAVAAVFAEAAVPGDAGI